MVWTQTVSDFEPTIESFVWNKSLVNWNSIQIDWNTNIVDWNSNINILILNIEFAVDFSVDSTIHSTETHLSLIEFARRSNP